MSEDGKTGGWGVVDSERTLTIPGRWFEFNRTATREWMCAELTRLGKVFADCEAPVVDLYFRMVDHARSYELDPEEIHDALVSAGFPASRVSEFKRLAFAPEEVWHEYCEGKLGFKLALRKTRMFYQTRQSVAGRNRRLLRRAAGVVVRWLRDLDVREAWEFRLGGWVMVCTPESEYNKHRGGAGEIKVD